MAQDPTGGGMKILTSIQKQNIVVWYLVKERDMKEDNVVTAAALIMQESTESEKCWGEEQLHWVQTPTRTLSRCVQTESKANFRLMSFAQRPVFSSASDCTHQKLCFFLIIACARFHVQSLLSLASWRKMGKVEMGTKFGIKNTLSFHYNYPCFCVRKRSF